MLLKKITVLYKATGNGTTRSELELKDYKYHQLISKATTHLLLAPRFPGSQQQLRSTVLELRFLLLGLHCAI